MTAPVASVGLTRDPEGSLAWALAAHAVVIAGPTAGPTAAWDVALDALVTTSVHAVYDDADVPISLTVISRGEGAVPEEVLQALLDRLGVYGIGVDDIDGLPVERLRAAVATEVNYSGPLSADQAFRAYARTLGAEGPLSDAQAVAVAVACPPRGVWSWPLVLPRSSRAEVHNEAVDQNAREAGTQRSRPGMQPRVIASTAAVPEVGAGAGAIPMSERLLTREMLRQIIPVSDMALWRWMRKGWFPQPIKFNGRNYWLASEVQEWIEIRGAERSSPRGQGRGPAA